MDRRVWRALVHGIANSQTWLSVHTIGFFMVQLSHLYMNTGKTITLTIWTFFGKVMSLLFNALSSFVIAFLPRSKRRLISWLQSLSPVALEPKKIKSVTVSTFSPSICHEMMGLDAIILFLWILSFKPVRELLWGSSQRACQQEVLVPETLGGNSTKIYQKPSGLGGALTRKRVLTHPGREGGIEAGGATRLLWAPSLRGWKDNLVDSILGIFFTLLFHCHQEAV